MSTPAFWQVCLESFQRELTQQQFNTWIRPLRLEIAGEGLKLIAPNRFVLQWVKERFAGRIEELAAVAVGRPLQLAFVVAEGDRALPAVALPSAPKPGIVSSKMISSDFPSGRARAAIEGLVKRIEEASWEAYGKHTRDPWEAL